MDFHPLVNILAHCSELVLDEGLFPHTNAGNLNKSEMNDLKKNKCQHGAHVRKL